MRAWVLVVIIGLLVAACGSSGGINDGAPAVTTQAASCPDPPAPDEGTWFPDDSPLEPLADDVVPTRVLSCRIEPQNIPGEGRWAVLITSWADADLQPFVDALRAPDEKPTDGACPLMLLMTPWFALVTADGSVVRARVPLTECHQPQGAALDAFAALPFKVVKETRIRQTETEEAQKSGCPQQWKNVFAIEAGPEEVTSSAERPVFSYPATSRARVCHYRSDGTDAEETQTGTFAAADMLTGASWAAVVEDLEGAPAAKDCATTSPTFAVVMSRPDGPSVTVETEGCQRMLTDSDELRQAPKSLLAALR